MECERDGSTRGMGWAESRQRCAAPSASPGDVEATQSDTPVATEQELSRQSFFTEDVEEAHRQVQERRKREAEDCCRHQVASALSKAKRAADLSAACRAEATRSFESRLHIFPPHPTPTGWARPLSHFTPLPMPPLWPPDFQLPRGMPPPPFLFRFPFAPHPFEPLPPPPLFLPRRMRRR